MSNFLQFFSFADPNVRFVVMGTVLLGASAAIVGCFTFLRKRALVGDAIAHSILPGVCLAFMLSGNKNPLILMAGAVATGWLSLLMIDWITRSSKLKSDTAIGLVLSVFFGMGILLLTSIQHSGNAAQSGLDKFLFGKAASLSPQDSVTFAIIGVALICIVFLFYKEFRLICFNPEYAKSIGLPVKFLEFMLSTVTVMSVASGIQAVGVVLMSALLVTPAAAARFWTNRMGFMILLASIFGAISGLAGSYVSFTSPDMPTGPWIVMVVSLIALSSIVIAPRKGILARLSQHRRNRRKILRENILKAFYNLGEKDGDFMSLRTFEDILALREFNKGTLKKGIRSLWIRRYLHKEGRSWQFTPDGLEEGKRVVRLHRLWELYLTERLNLEADHIHNDAEAMEHILTPELEAQLMHELNYPETDPHHSQIPMPGK